MLEKRDLRIEVYRAKGPDGARIDRAVRVTHLPSGITAASQGNATEEEDVAAAIAQIEAELSVLMSAADRCG